jgi:hypothetical protein
MTPIVGDLLRPFRDSPRTTNISDEKGKLKGFPELDPEIERDFETDEVEWSGDNARIRGARDICDAVKFKGWSLR